MTIDEILKRIDAATAPPMSKEQAKAALEEIIDALRSRVECLIEEIADE